MAAPGRSFATGLLALGLAACGGATGEQEPPAAPVAAANDVATPPSGKVVLSHAARSIWGVVPDPPRRKRDLQPDLIRGTAVAIAPDTLLAKILDGLRRDDDSDFVSEVRRREIRDRIARFRQMIRDEVRRRTAEQRGRDQVAKSSVPKQTEQVEFLTA